MKREVTIFKNILETDAPFHREVIFILERIKQGKNKELVKSIRAEKDKTSLLLLLPSAFRPAHQSHCKTIALHFKKLLVNIFE